MPNHFEEIREQIRKMIDGTGGDYEWDDHMYVHKSLDKATNALIMLAANASRWFPAGKVRRYCSPEGFEHLQWLLDATSNQRDAGDTQ